MISILTFIGGVILFYIIGQIKDFVTPYIISDNGGCLINIVAVIVNGFLSILWLISIAIMVVSVLSLFNISF